LDNPAASALTSELGVQKPWKLYTYQNGQNIDVSEASDAFAVTRGVWFKTFAKASSFNLSFGAGDLVGTATHPITVQTGWTLVGAPFLGEEASWTPLNTTAGSNGIRVYKYSHEQSQWVLLNPASERMKPFGGYAVYNGTGAAATFTFVRGGPTTKVVEWEPGDGWYAVLDVGGSSLRIGQHRLAQEGMDGYDYPMPPPRPEGTGDESYVSNKMWSDIRPVSSTRVTSWRVYVDPKVTQFVKAEEVVKLPSDWKIVVKDIPYVGAEELTTAAPTRLPAGVKSPYWLTVLVGPRSLVEQMTIPGEYALHQNYPNPFNPTTAISYHLPAEAPAKAGVSAISVVALRVYDVLGREIATLVKGEQKPGYYVVQWNGLDDLGKRVASGVYFYRMQTENFSAVRKMIKLD
jgi:hypothetical protein